MASRGAVQLGFAKEEPTQSGGGSTGGGGDLVGHRLGELERRVGNLEESVSDVRQTVTRIEEQLKGVATKHFVLYLLAGVLVTLVGHLLIRSLSG